MQVETFKRVVTTFADPQTELLIERERTLVQVNGNLLDVSLKLRSGEVIVVENGTEIAANQWILTRLAQLPLLADRLAATVPATIPFVTPEAELLESLEVRPQELVEHVSDALESTLRAIDNRSPLESTVLYITSDAGEGKTSLINQMARDQAERFKSNKSDWLLVPIPLGGRHFLRFDDITVGALQNRYRFPFLYYNSFIELVRLGVIVPAFDGFEEMFVEDSSGEALSAMGILVGSLQSTGALIIAARKAYFEFENLKSQARLYDTIKQFAVGFGKVALIRWKKKQFLDYCKQRRYLSAERLYSRVISRLDPDHSLLTRPVLVRRLVDIAEDSETLDDFLAKLQVSGADFFAVFVQGIVEREANDKWIDRVGEPAQPLLSVSEHCELLSLIALEMWQARVDFLKTDLLEFAVDLFCETNRKAPTTTSQIRARIKGHALLIASPNASGAVEFDHEEFRLFFLGEAIARLLLNPIHSTRADLLNILRRAVLPAQAFTAVVQRVKRGELSRRLQAIILLSEIAILDGQTSFTHENCASLVLSLLSGEERGREITLRRIAFPTNVLRDKRLSGVTFCECYFGPTSLENSVLDRCQFQQCQFARLDAFASTSVSASVLLESAVDGLSVHVRGQSYFEPASLRIELVQLGFVIPDSTEELPLEARVNSEKEEAVSNFEKVLRYFGRSTHISESVIRMKLGNASNTFLLDVLPVLLQGGLLVEIENKGGGVQRRFKLGRTMENLTRSLEGCGGSLETLIEQSARLDLAGAFSFV